MHMVVRLTRWSHYLCTADSDDDRSLAPSRDALHLLAMRDPDLATALSDRYVVERELGTGGMATVYLARDLKHQRSVAIKLLHPDIAESLGSERFLREIHLAAALMHPHILPLFDSGEAAGRMFYVMPNAEGQSLRDRLDVVKQLPVDEAVRIAIEVADALDYAHRRGVVHRDIKPENIMLHDGHALVADFGVGKAVLAAAAEGRATLTQVGVTVGTPAYMSPEQAAGDTVDGRSDLFALGCMLYEMLTGEQPFVGPTLQATIAKRFHHTPPTVGTLRSGIPAALSETVNRLLEKDPDARISTGAMVVAALRAATSGSYATSPNLAIQRGAATSPNATATPSGTTQQSVAVLPFANLSAGADDEYFADGITEEIISVLARVPGLHVAPRTSSFALKGKGEDLKVIGERLGVRHVLEGSVRKAGPRLRITARLTGAREGYTLWSERYDRELVDVFALQDELAEAIAGKLQITLLESSASSEQPRGALRSVEAYEALLKGRVLLGQRGRAIVDSIPCLERAVALDRELVDGWALLGDAYRLVWIYGMAPASATIPQAGRAIERALALEPEHVQALSTLANIAASYDLDVEAAVALADRALARDPSHVQAMVERSVVLALRASTSEQRVAELLKHLEQARRLDPLNAWAAAMQAMSFASIGRAEDALTVAREAVELDHNAFTGRWMLVWSLAMLGRDEEALAAAEETLPMSGRNPRVLAEMAAIHARRGEHEPAKRILAELQQRAKTGFVELAVIGAVHAALGDMNEARALVARGIAEHEAGWQFVKSPAWQQFRGDREGLAMLREHDFG
jgi:serine/threonine-protein kinase